MPFYSQLDHPHGFTHVNHIQIKSLKDQHLIFMLLVFCTSSFKSVLFMISQPASSSTVYKFINVHTVSALHSTLAVKTRCEKFNNVFRGGAQSSQGASQLLKHGRLGSRGRGETKRRFKERHAEMSK